MCKSRRGVNSFAERFVCLRPSAALKLCQGWGYRVHDFPLSWSTTQAWIILQKGVSLIQHESSRSKIWTNTRNISPCNFACVLLLKPNWQPANQPVGPPLNPTGHRENIPDAALFHNSHHVWFVQGRVLTESVENPTEERRWGSV